MTHIARTLSRFSSLALVAALSLAVAACAGGAGDAGAPGTPGGGNVGFGGAQDIGQFRGLLEDGEIPGANTLDANGFFSEHFTEVLPADCGQVLCPNGMLAVGRDWVTGGMQTVLQLNITTPIDPSTLVRNPLSMVVVVDTSGSMAVDGRLDYVKQGLLLLIDNLQDGDRLAVVEYNSGARVVATFDQQLDREALKRAVERMRPTGSTNLYAGLELGLSMVADSYDVERQNRVVLLSDGLPTAGIQDTSSIIAMAEGYIGDGIGLTTIGVGRDFNLALMRGLSERGAGNFYFLEDASAVQEVFTEELDYFTTPIALDVELLVTTADGYSVRDVAGTKMWAREGNGGVMRIPAAFVASRTSTEPGNGRRGGGSSVFMRLDRTAAAAVGQVATVTLRYRLPDTGEQVEQVITVENPNAFGAEVEETWVSHQAMVKNYAVYNLYLGLREASTQAAWNYDCAYDALQAVRAVAVAWNVPRNDEDIVADIALIDMFAANLVSAGADPELAGEQCATAGGPWDGTPDDGFGDGFGDDGYYYEDQHGCSVGGSDGPGAGFVLLLAALAFTTRRRRR